VRHPSFLSFSAHLDPFFPAFTVPNVDLSPLCSPLFRPGPPADEAQVLSSRLRDILLAFVSFPPFLLLFPLLNSLPCSSNVLPLSSLVIEPGKAVWVVYLDIVCLNYDGGILDAAVLASVGALKNREPSFHPVIINLNLLTIPLSYSRPPSSNLRHRHAASGLRACFGDFARFADTARR
jgi:hypothetical protein